MKLERGGLMRYKITLTYYSDTEGANRYCPICREYTGEEDIIEQSIKGQYKLTCKKCGTNFLIEEVKENDDSNS